MSPVTAEIADVALTADLAAADVSVTVELVEQTVQVADVGIPGPPGNTAAAEALIASFMARAGAVVLVRDGTEARPPGPFCLWLGGDTEPTHMGADDLWAPTAA